MSDVRDTGDRFELDVDGGTAFAAYTLAGEVMTFTHTIVPPELEGHGVASRLIAAALTQVRARGLKIVPQCAFVQAYLERHGEDRELLA